MRQAMKSLPEVITKSRPTVDYTETLGAIAKRLEIVGNFMAAIEQHPAIRYRRSRFRSRVVATGRSEIIEADMRNASTVTLIALRRVFALRQRA